MPTRSPGIVMAGIAVVVTVVILTAIILAAPTPSSTPRQQDIVTEVEWSFNTCWENTTGPGLTTGHGSQFSASVTLSLVRNQVSCQAQSISVPAGFEYVGANVPLTVTSTSSETLNVTLAWLGSSDFSGPLNIHVEANTVG